MVTLDEVKELIIKNFKDADVSEILQEGNRVYGFIRSIEFLDLDPDDRNELVQERIPNKLGREAWNLGWLLPMTPDELLFGKKKKIRP